MRRIATSAVLVAALAVALIPLVRAEPPTNGFAAAEQLCETQGGDFMDVGNPVSFYLCLV